MAEVQREVAREVESIVSRVWADRQRQGRLDLEAAERAVRESMHQAGSFALEQLINADGGGHCGARLDCGAGHQAAFADYRQKGIDTLLGPVQVRRAYYHCGQCGRGVAPKDLELDIEGTSYSPGLRRLIGRVGAKEPFEEGRTDLGELAGVRVSSKAVERVSESLGEQAEALSQAERRLALSGKLLPFSSKPAPTMYIAMDGTGVPILPRDAEGRRSKQGEGRARTREAKLGCVFTQTALDAQGRPQRDEGSTSYAAAIEAAEPFGRRIYAEAVRRGLARAGRAAVLGDGAPWVWGIAEEHFHGATQILDLYHALQRLSGLAKLALGADSPEAERWAAARSKQLGQGEVEAVVDAIRQLRPADRQGREEVRKAANYFSENARRMRYATFRSLGLFVGSGVVEAGCKTVVCQRLKQSGMRWSVRGANAIIALRCWQLSHRWEEFWEARSAG